MFQQNVTPSSSLETTKDSNDNLGFVHLWTSVTKKEKECFSCYVLGIYQIVYVSLEEYSQAIWEITY